jgi:hypothetical protein
MIDPTKISPVKPYGVSGALSDIGQFLINVAHKVAHLVSIVAKEVGHLTYLAGSLFVRWSAIGFSYAKQWTWIGLQKAKEGAIIGWEFGSKVAVKAFWATLAASRFALIHLKQFLSFYRTEVTFFGLGVVATVAIIVLSRAMETPVKKEPSFFERLNPFRQEQTV